MPQRKRVLLKQRQFGSTPTVDHLHGSSEIFWSKTAEEFVKGGKCHRILDERGNARNAFRNAIANAILNKIKTTREHLFENKVMHVLSRIHAVSTTEKLTTQMSVIYIKSTRLTSRQLFAVFENILLLSELLERTPLKSTNKLRSASSSPKSG